MCPALLQMFPILGQMLHHYIPCELVIFKEKRGTRKTVPTSFSLLRS